MTDQPAGPIPPSVIWVGLGIFLGALVGMLAFNAAASIGPTTTENGLVLRTEVDIGTSTNNSNDTTTYFVAGETDSGQAWRFASTEAYELAAADGLPLEVSLDFSDLTGTVVGLRTGDIDASQNSLAHKIGWTAAATIALLVGLAAVLAARKEAGTLGIVGYLIGFAPIGCTVGFVVLRAFRAG